MSLLGPARTRQLREAHGEKLSEVRGRQAKVELMEVEIQQNATTLQRQWREGFEWLTNMGFIGDAEGTLTARGRACAAFADGHPLIIGTIISDEWLRQLNLGEVGVPFEFSWRMQRDTRHVP